MARPRKKGLDWFKHDTNLSQSEKVNDLIIDSGVEAYGVYIILIEYIYSTLSTSYSDALLKTVSKRALISITDLKAIVRKCLKIGLFDPAAFKDKQLTNAAIESQLEKVTTTRESERHRVNDFNAKNKDCKIDSKIKSLNLKGF